MITLLCKRKSLKFAIFDQKSTYFNRIHQRWLWKPERIYVFTVCRSKVFNRSYNIQLGGFYGFINRIRGLIEWEGISEGLVLILSAMFRGHALLQLYQQTSLITMLCHFYSRQNNEFCLCCFRSSWWTGVREAAASVILILIIILPMAS